MGRSIIQVLVFLELEGGDGSTIAPLFFTSAGAISIPQTTIERALL